MLVTTLVGVGCAEDEAPVSADVQPATTPAAVRPRPADGPWCVTSSRLEASGENQPMTIELCVSDVAPAIDQVVEVTVDAEDPDAGLLPLGQCAPNTVRFGDERTECFTQPSCVAPTDQPDPVRGTLVETVEHAYSTAGAYTIEVILHSGSLCPHPYSSEATADLGVTVN